MRAGRGKALAIASAALGLPVLVLGAFLLKEPAGRWWTWNKVLPFRDRDLTQLRSEDAEALERALSALGIAATEQETRLHSLISLRDGRGNPRYALLFSTEQVFQSRVVRVFLLDQAGRRLSETPISMGGSLLRIRKTTAPLSAAELIRIETERSRQYYAVHGDRTELVRLEDDGGNLADRYQVAFGGPPVPELQGTQWRDRLASGQWAETLSLLTLLGDAVLCYRLQAGMESRLLHDSLVSEIRKLAHSPDPWTSEAATRVLQVHRLDQDP